MEPSDLIKAENLMTKNMDQTNMEKYHYGMK